MSTSCSLPLNLPLHRPQSPLQRPNICSPFPLSKPSCRSLSSSLVRSTLSSNSSNYEREEARWLREEQRWLREEQRWLREESRWHAERESLIREISALKLRIEELERQGTIHGLNVPNAVAVLPILNTVAELGSGVVPMVLETGEREKVVEEDVQVAKEAAREGKKDAKEMKERVTLRKGSEGDEVKAMQDALQKLGFYCGEEDLEFSSFTSGTERAVKTWQATLGVPEDGIMTAQLQERLYMEYREGTNGAALASVTEISETQHKIVEDKGATEVEVSQHRVFLIGENRWEEPSRLAGRNEPADGAWNKGSTRKCLSCRGEGRLLCTECDGSGEPNIEPQFLEWIDEGMKCPYCEGLGFTTCDVCDGKGEAVV